MLSQQAQFLLLTFVSANSKDSFGFDETNFLTAFSSHSVFDEDLFILLVLHWLLHKK
jgi:hypothetical protein